MKRYAFIPVDYREPAVLGWRTHDGGWLPDEPCGTEGFLVLVKSCSDTPTIPPLPGDPDSTEPEP